MMPWWRRRGFDGLNGMAAKEKGTEPRIEGMVYPATWNEVVRGTMARYVRVLRLMVGLPSTVLDDWCRTLCIS